MRLSTTSPTTTKKYHIEVPTHTYGSPTAVFKIWFGKKYLIWKGKSLLQSCEFIAENIERYARLQKNIETDMLYHVCKHIKATRCIRATVEVLATDFERPKSGTLDGFLVLRTEQDELDRCAADPMCLNNNEQAYIPAWIGKKDEERFLAYYEKHHK